MWDEIEVEKSARLEIRSSTIEDAHYAIDFQNGAAVYIKEATFRRNYIGIYIEPSQSLKYIESDYNLGLPYYNLLDLETKNGTVQTNRRQGIYRGRTRSDRTHV